MTNISSWTALKNPVFRKLWIASLLSGTCVAAHDTAATWVMNTLTPAPFLISVMSTVASLPFFLLTLPAGALADLVDRKKLLCVINLWLATAAAGLAILGWLHLLAPGVVLVCVFLIGVGFAVNAPAWISIVPQIVSDAELPAAVTLSGLQLNISGIIGPALGGLLIPLIGPSSVFAVNAACFFVVILAILNWKRATEQTKLPLESFFESFVTAIRYVRYAPGLQIVLARNVLFALFISVIPALLPVVGLKTLHLGACQLGLLFTSLGAGSVAAAAFVIPWLRARFSSNTIIVLANLLVVLVYVLMALVRQRELFLGVAALAGVGWTLSASELWVAAQRSMPAWARGRMNATVIMVSQGAMALGGVIWGCAATKAGAGYTLIGAAFLFLISLILAAPLSINFTGMLNFDLAPVTSFSHRLVYTPQPRDGPMSITLEFNIDCARAPEFLSLMREVRLIHLRNGAYGWRLHEDLTRSNTFRLEFVVRSWKEHLLQRERMTNAEKHVLEKVRNLHMRATPPEERIYLAISNGLYTPRQCTFNAPVPSTCPRNFEIQEIQCVV